MVLTFEPPTSASHTRRRSCCELRFEDTSEYEKSESTGEPFWPPIAFGISSWFITMCAVTVVWLSFCNVIGMKGCVVSCCERIVLLLLLLLSVMMLLLLLL